MAVDLLGNLQRGPREVRASGILAVPPHLHAQTGASVCLARLRSVFTPWRPGHLHSCRWLSRPSDQGLLGSLTAAGLHVNNRHPKRKPNFSRTRDSRHTGGQVSLVATVLAYS
jgi:hypothetical protein